ncbi:MAG TPA: hypothetical protein VFH61_06530 [Thermoleophilia bacterium]|nr:hypothetical protein [Thermoleophilia bacterium]
MAINVIQAVHRLLDDHWRARQFNATVVGFEGSNQMTVSRLGTTVVEGPYVAAEGVVAAVVPGDRVKVEYVSGTYQVAYKLGSVT